VAQEAFNQAAAVAEGRYAKRVRRAAMAISYTALLRWDELRDFRERGKGTAWPFAKTTKRGMFAHLKAAVREFGVTLLSEWGADIDSLEKQVFASESGARFGAATGLLAQPPRRAARGEGEYLPLVAPPHLQRPGAYGE
jgi:hypothetical protein